MFPGARLGRHVSRLYVAPRPARQHPSLAIVISRVHVSQVLDTYESKREAEGVDDKPNAIFEKCHEVSAGERSREIRDGGGVGG